jgi:hypothetical protein
MDEQDFRSKEHVTRHMTLNRYGKTEEATDVDSWPEQDYLSAKLFKARTLGVKFYETRAQIFMSLKISKDRQSRIEDKEVLQGMYEDEKGFNTGLPIVKRAISALSSKEEE